MQPDAVRRRVWIGPFLRQLPGLGNMLCTLCSDNQCCIQCHIQLETKTDGQAGRQSDRQIDRQTVRQTVDRQTTRSRLVSRDAGLTPS